VGDAHDQTVMSEMTLFGSELQIELQESE
jgi:hypothetical protein